jgi:hypothetical protein
VLTGKEDEAKHEPHIPPRRFKHSGEGSAEDTAEYVGAVREFVLRKVKVKRSKLGTLWSQIHIVYYRKVQRHKHVDCLHFG